MPGRAQLSRRHFSIRARSNQRKIKKGGKKMATTWFTDFINTKLIPIKVTFFLIMGATQTTAPYASLLKKELGLTVKEAAIIYTVGPLVAVFAPFLAGIITDKVGNFRKFLVISVAINGILGLSVLVIPVARTYVGKNETEIPFSLTCNERSFRLSYDVNPRCSHPDKNVFVESINATKCGYMCSPPAVIIDPEINEDNVIKFQNINLNDTVFFACEISKEVSKVNQKCYITNNNRNNEFNARTFRLDTVYLAFNTAHIESRDWGKYLELDLTKNYNINDEEQRKYFDCLNGYEGERTHNVSLTQTKISTYSTDHKIEVVECYYHCSGVLPLEKICTISSLVIEYDVGLSVGLFIVSNLLTVFMTGLTYTMFEAAVVAVMKEFNYDYGIQRIYGAFGGIVFAPLSGFLIDYFGNGSYTDYYIASFMFFFIKLVCSLILTKLDLDFKKPTKRICGNITDIFSSIESVLLIMIVCISGICYGFIENFLPWHLHDLGAKNWMIGLMTTVASCSSLPFLALSDPICRKFGYVQSICFGLICYSVRCFGYSMIRNPFWCFPFEVLEGITTGLLVAAAIIYGAHLSSLSNVGTLQGILATSHYGLGKSIGSFLGGYMMDKLSAEIAFRVLSGIAFAAAFGYYIFFKLVIFPRREKQLEDVRNMPVEVIPVSDLTNELNEEFEDLQKRYNPEAYEDLESSPCTSTPRKF